MIPERILQATLSKLEERSAGSRESAAIWVGNLSDEDATVAEAYFHHELCDDHATPLSLKLSEQAKFNLYQSLAKSGLKLVALIHTHPAAWVDLSPVDQANQISSRIGFWSLVVPWYGRKPWQLTAFGVHVRGDVGWRRIPKSQIPEHVIIVD